MASTDPDGLDPSSVERLGLVRPKPTDRPNVVVIVLDDVGFGQLGCFGSTIETPAIDRLANEGLRFNRFHVTAMCSPTRAAFFTGRNAHRVGMGFVADVPLDYPGYTGRIPRSAATVAEHLLDAGFSTRAIGKWHLVPRYERSDAGPFDNWPLGLGFERYYGFLQGDTNHWRPNLVEDNHYVEDPASWPEDYHLSEDLIDRALREIDGIRFAAPGKPFFSYVALGAAHAPHHAPKEWIDHYRGAFDKGWDEWRRDVIARQEELGVIPVGTTPSERPSWVAAWSELSGDEQRLFARQQEVFAAFLSHADAQIGRLIDGLAARGELDNTIVMLFSDNGASAEGGTLGSVNEHRFTAHVPEVLSDNLDKIDAWGGPETYNHYSWGWAWAGNAPFRLWKRFTWLGGTRTPLIVRYPAAIADPGAVRNQLLHAVDLAPTILDLTGVDAPTMRNGVEQMSFDGTSAADILRDPAAPSPRSTQYFELLGSRSIIHGGFKATTNHVPEGIVDEEHLMEGSRAFPDDSWELFDLANDFAEVNNVAAAHPDVVEDLAAKWLEEANDNHVLPLFDTLMARFAAMLGPVWPAGSRIELGPDAPPLSDEVLPLLFGGFSITATFDHYAPNGVLCSLGDHFGGFSFFLDDNRAVFTLATPTVTTELVSPDLDHPTSLAVVHTLEQGGTLTILADGVPLCSTLHPDMVPAAFQHGGTSLRVGFDTEFTVSPRYAAPNRFAGTLTSLVIDTDPSVVAEFSRIIADALHAD
jgi:arylsulfatase A-like enzyme